jgi:hypothetical protein
LAAEVLGFVLSLVPAIGGLLLLTDCNTLLEMSFPDSDFLTAIHLTSAVTTEWLPLFEAAGNVDLHPFLSLLQAPDSPQ